MKNQQFISVKVFRPLLLMCLVLTACSQPSAGSTQAPIAPTATLAPLPSQPSTAVPTSTPAPIVSSPTPFPTFTAAGAKTALVDAFTQLAKAFPFRITETDQGPADTTYVTTDYAAADRYHSITTQAKRPNQDETITIGNKTWWKLKGTWDPTPSGTLPQNNFWNMIPKAQDVTYSGQASLNGVPCFVFSFTLHVQATGLYLTGSGQAWVGVSDGLPYQLVFTPGANTTGTPSQQVYTYAITVDIQQPSP